MMAHNMGAEKAKILYQPLLPISEMRCTLTRFHICDFAKHCPLAMETTLTGSLVHDVLRKNYSMRPPNYLDLYSPLLKNSSLSFKIQ